MVYLRLKYMYQACIKYTAGGGGAFSIIDIQASAQGTSIMYNIFSAFLKHEGRSAFTFALGGEDEFGLAFRCPADYCS